MRDQHVKQTGKLVSGNSAMALKVALHCLLQLLWIFIFPIETSGVENDDPIVYDASREVDASK